MQPGQCSAATVALLQGILHPSSPQPDDRNHHIPLPLPLPLPLRFRYAPRTPEKKKEERRDCRVPWSCFLEHVLVAVSRNPPTRQLAHPLFFFF